MQGTLREWLASRGLYLFPIPQEDNLLPTFGIGIEDWLVTGRLDPPAILTAYHDDGTACGHGFLQAVQPPWCAGGQHLSRLQITPASTEDHP